MHKQLYQPIQTIQERVKALRQAMQGQAIDAYIVPSNDPHQSEYVANHWKLRAWLSGFTGSAGTIVVRPTTAGLWTDSRYFLQAEEELKDSGIQLHKLGPSRSAGHLKWLKEELPLNSRIGFDGQLFSVEQVRQMQHKLEEKEIELVDIDLLSNLWVDRTPLPTDTVFELPTEAVGQSRQEKLLAVQQKLREQEVDFHLVTALDDIAWLFNLRGKDVDCNPVFYSYAIIGQNIAHLFVDFSKISDDIRAHLKADGVFLKSYDLIEVFLNELTDDRNILLDPAATSHRLHKALGRTDVVEGKPIIPKLKSIRNEVEVKFLRQAMQKDGVALVRLYRWLEAELQKRTVTECEIADQLDAFRKAQGDYFGESFPAIVGYASNGAIVHYRPEPETCAEVKNENILLLDSGGQYLQGTTDITRTVALGEPTAEQRRHFTLVLKGMIALSDIRFPKGTAGIQLDALARQYLWKEGLNYGHGTGHGVGFFLNVHEPPQSISASPAGRALTQLQPGMVTSNEPGFYKDGDYGIRTENLILCVESEEEGFCHFETLTLFPIDTRLMDNKLLSATEKDWLNTYHQKVFEQLSPLLEQNEVEWLRAKCEAI